MGPNKLFYYQLSLIIPINDTLSLLKCFIVSGAVTAGAGGYLEEDGRPRRLHSTHDLPLSGQVCDRDGFIGKLSRYPPF